MQNQHGSMIKLVNTWIQKTTLQKDYSQLAHYVLSVQKEITLHTSRWQSTVRHSKSDTINEIKMKNEKSLLYVPSLLCHLLAFVTFVVLLMHWFTKLNSQSEWSLSPTGSFANSTCSIGQNSDGGLTSADGADNTAKTSPTYAQRRPDIGVPQP